MFKYLLVTILLIGSVFAGDSDGYFLSPPLPPTAFVGQYYTAQFRVVGLDFPSFKFSGLPKCFVGTSDGAIEGNPDKAGSYAVTITFTDGGKSYSRQIVVRIASSVSSTEGTNEAGVLSQNQFIIVSPSNNYVYQAGDQINLKLAANNGVSPYTWSYINLPSELRGDKDGVLNGVFNREGYYSFSASCSDSNGKAVDSYFTFNVQPKTLTKSIFNSIQAILLKFPTEMFHIDTILIKLQVKPSLPLMQSMQPSQTLMINKKKLHMPEKTTLKLKWPLILLLLKQIMLSQ